MLAQFQNGVVRSIKNVTDDGSSWTLDYDGNVQYMNLSVSIPTRSLIITFCGVALVLVSALLVVIATRCGRRPLLKDTTELTPEMVADLMLYNTKYPPLLLARRFDTGHANGTRNSFDQFQIDGLRLHHETMGTVLVLPLSTPFEKNDDLQGRVSNCLVSGGVYYGSQTPTPCDGRHSDDGSPFLTL